MKKNIFAALVAVCALAIGCTKTEVSKNLSTIQLDNSYVSIDQAGGSTTITVTATEAWDFDATAGDYAKVVVQPDVIVSGAWLNIDIIPANGNDAKITFSAEKYDGTRSANLCIKTASGDVQHLIVGQGVPTISAATCAEIIAGPDNKVYRVTGTVTRIAESVKYGNWYINDGTGEVYIYGTKYNGQTQQAALEKLGIEVGDILTIEGPKTTYNGTVELVDVDVIDIVKCLITAAPAAIDGIEKDGGEFEVKLVIKGKTFDITEQPEWVELTGMKIESDTTRLTFNALPNEGDTRTGNIVFQSVSGKQTSEATVAVSQKSGLSSYPLPYIETFNESLGAFEIQDIDVAGSKSGYVWSFATYNNSGYAKGSSGAKNNTESDLVSPLIDLTKVTEAKLSFEHAQKYAGNVYDEFTVWVSANNGENWEQLLVPVYPAPDYVFVNSSEISLNKFVGNQIRVKFKYKSNTEFYGTWEIRNLKIEEGAATITSIAALQSLAVAQGTNSDFTATLTDACVTYVNGNNAFVEDATGGVLVYNSNHGLHAGDKINGTVTGVVTVYGGFAEVTTFNVSAATVTAAQGVTSTTITLDKLKKSFNRYVSCMIKLEGVTLDADLGSNRNANVKQGEETLSAYAKVKNTVTINKDVNGDLICFPCYNNSIEKPQVGIWEASHFTAK